MKKKIIATLVFSLLVNLIHAQTANFQWAKKMGGALDFDDQDQSYGITTDIKGNIYVAGCFVDTLYFFSGTDTSSLISAGDYDGYISKYDSLGNFLWAKQIGGALTDNGYSVAVDAIGNVFTTGTFKDTVYFDKGTGRDTIIAAGRNDIFIAKFDASGNYVWTQRIGGVAKEQGNAITLDDKGNVYTTGTFSDTVDFDPGPAVFKLNSAGQSAIFISKLSNAGKFLWAKQIGGTLSDFCISNAIKTDALGNVFTTGSFSGTTDFDPGAGTYNFTSFGSSMDIFISKLDSSGNFIWAKQMGGTSDDKSFSLALDVSANVYTTGNFATTADFDPGTGIYNLISAGSNDVFISKLDSSGKFIWAKQIGGSSLDESASIALDDKANVYTTGSFKGKVDFDPGPGIEILSSDSVEFENIFISKLDASGNYVWAKQMGGALGGSAGTAIAIDAKGNVCTTGIFIDTIDIDPGVGVFNLYSTTFSIFLQRLSQGSNSGIHENILQNGITLFPNPCKDVINLSLDKAIKNASIAVVNMNGQTVMEKENLTGSRFTIDISNQAKGLYIIEVKNTENISRIKVLKI